MKILVDLSVMELPATGIAKVVSGLYRAVAVRRPDVETRGLHRRPLLSSAPPSMHTERIAAFLPPSLWRLIAIPRAARHQRDAFIHFPWNGGVPHLPQGTRIVTTLHDVLPLLIPGFFAREEEERKYRRQRQKDLDRSEVVVTDSEFSKQEIMRNFRVERAPIVIPCATDIGAHPKEAHQAEYPYFLYAGGLDPRKSVDTLLSVFLRLATDGDLHSRLIVTGSRRHAPESLARLLDEGVRSGHVDDRGYVTDQELARLYAGALALVYPSRYEGFGMPPLEAMTLGCPVITCRTTSLPEVCGEAAYYVEPGDRRSLARAFTLIETDPLLRQRLSFEGRKRSALFSWDGAAAAFLKALTEFNPPPTH